MMFNYRSALVPVLTLMGALALPAPPVAAQDTVPIMETIPVVVVADGAKVRKEPAKFGEVLTEAEFGDHYWLLGRKEAEGGRQFVECSKTDPGSEAPQSVGWIETKDVLTTNEALRENSGIYIKGLVVNTWRSTRDSTEIEGAKVLKGPGTKPDGNPYGLVKELGLFKFHFVYDRRDDPVSGKTFLLLGNQPRIVRSTKPLENLLGWVHKDRIREWNTRQSVEIDKGTLAERRDGIAPELAGVSVYETKPELVASLKGLTEIEGTPIEPIAREDIEAGQWPHYLQRYPLFEVEGDNSMASSGTFFKVGFIGDQIFVSGDQGVSADQLALNQQKLEQIKEDLRRIEILFVIDSTGSMHEFYDTAANAIEMITQQMKDDYPAEEGQRPEIRYSVLFYRDYVDYDGQEGNPDDTYLVKRLPVTADVSKVVRFIRNEKDNIPDGAGGDNPEAVYNAVLEAISRSSEELHENSFKSVVLVGDAGNHVNDPKGHTAETVAEALRARGFDFYSVHVVNPDEASKVESYKDFHEQTTRIRSLMETSNSFGVQTKRLDQIAGEIVRVSREQADNAGLSQAAIEELMEGALSLVDLKGKYGLQVTRKLTDIMAREGVDVGAYIAKSVQIFDEGWVSQLDPYSGARQVRETVLVDRSDFEKLIAIVSGFVKDPPTRSSVLTVWKKSLADQIGEDNVNVDKSIAEQIQAHLGLPVQRNILNRSITEIASMTPEELDSAWLDLKFDLARIRSIYSEIQAEVTREGSEIKTKDLGNRQVWWDGAGLEYGWIPLDEMP